MHPSPRSGRWRNALANCLLILGSLVFCFAAAEAFLRLYEGLHATSAVAVTASVPAPQDGDTVLPPELVARAEQRRAILTLPDDWKMTTVDPPPAGAYRAYRWHGIVFAENREAMRRTTPFPPKDPGKYRVLVIGDSLTYGVGIREQDTFTGLLNAWMGRDFNIEFLNLGVPGYQSEDILKIEQRFVPELKPDLVIYAMCLNDFLGSGEGQYNHNFNFPLPEAIQRFFLENTRTGLYLADLYDRTLRTLHVRYDFYDDILSDFNGYQQRFARDVAEMNAFAQSAKLPPLVAIVVDQFPYYGDRGYKIAMAAEQAFKNAKIDAIPIEDYYRRYSGKPMYVSRWEGHPDEVANFIWAQMIMKKLESRPDIKSFHKAKE